MDPEFDPEFDDARCLRILQAHRFQRVDRRDFVSGQVQGLLMRYRMRVNSRSESVRDEALPGRQNRKLWRQASFAARSLPDFTAAVNNADQNCFHSRTGARSAARPAAGSAGA
ncbi:MAG: hypothetical protein HY246_22805 [Proteobacteria bacterium]|nr:hypothetical protein [Pseudomonadota bacterium]